MSQCSAPAITQCGSGSIRNKLYSLGLQPSDVIEAVRQQSQEVTAGQVGMPPAPKDQAFQYTVDILSRFNDPAQFADIIVKDQTATGR